jgi:hypothetical protein
MSNQTSHILTVAHSVDLEATIGALGAYGIRVVSVDADVDTTFERVTQLTVRPTVDIDVPLIEYAVRGVGVEVLDLRPTGATLQACSP